MIGVTADANVWIVGQPGRASLLDDNALPYTPLHNRERVAHRSSVSDGSMTAPMRRRSMTARYVTFWRKSNFATGTCAITTSASTSRTSSTRDFPRRAVVFTFLATACQLCR